MHHINGLLVKLVELIVGGTGADGRERTVSDERSVRRAAPRAKPDVHRGGEAVAARRPRSRLPSSFLLRARQRRLRRQRQGVRRCTLILVHYKKLGRSNKALKIYLFQQTETPVGYAWLPLVKNDKLVLENDEQEFALSVAAELPSGYVQYQALGLGKGVLFDSLYNCIPFL